LGGSILGYEKSNSTPHAYPFLLFEMQAGYHDYANKIANCTFLDKNII